MRISDKALAALPPLDKNTKDRMHFDDEMAGFAVRQTPAGLTFLVRYRATALPRYRATALPRYRATGQQRQLPLGRWPGVTASQARKAALAARGQAMAGDDPWAERRAKGAAHKAAAAAAQAQAAVDEFTFSAMVEAWDEKLLRPHRRASYRNDTVDRLTRYFAPWSARPASSITRVEAARAIDRIECAHGRTSSHHGFSYARSAFNWAMKRDLVQTNPFLGLAAPGAIVARDHLLTDAEVGEVWRAAACLGVVPCAFVRTLMLTLARREEVAAMTWDELAPDLSLWTLPKTRAKNKREHRVAVAEPLRATLASLPRKPGCAFVFPSGAGRGLTTHSFHKRKMEAAIAAERAKANIKTPMPGWVFHDFRRAGVSTLARLGFPPHVCDKLLSRTSGAIRGVAAIYQRHDFAVERKAALEAWAAHVVACGEGAVAPGNVVQLHG